MLMVVGFFYYATALPRTPNVNTFWKMLFHNHWIYPLRVNSFHEGASEIVISDSLIRHES